MNAFQVPLMGSFRVQIDWFFEPMTNLYGFMDNNTQLETDTLVNNISLHTIRTGQYGVDLPTSVGYCFEYVPDCSLANMLYLPAGWNCRSDARCINSSGNEVSVFSLCADRFLSYIDIIRTFYTNKQERRALFYTPVDNLPEPNSAYPIPGVTIVSQRSLDDFFMYLRNQMVGIDLTLDAVDDVNKDYAPIMQLIDGRAINEEGGLSNGSAFFGLACMTYRPDLYRSVLMSSNAPLQAQVSVNNGMFTINALRYASHLQGLIDSYDISAGVFNDWIKSQWNVVVSGQLDRPILLSSSHQYISVEDIFATAYTSAGNDSVYLGDQAGAINQTRGFRNLRFHSKYHGILMGIMSIVPEVDYSQGIERTVRYTMFGDIFTPAMSKLGFANMERSEFCAILPTDSSPAVGVVAGRNVHWYEYMTDVNRTYGAFSVGRSLEHWTLNRQYLRDVTVDAGNEQIVFDPTTYIIPFDWQYMFAYQSPGAQNIFVQVAMEANFVRCVPKYVFGRIV